MYYILYTVFPHPEANIQLRHSGCDKPKLRKNNISSFFLTITNKHCRIHDTLYSNCLYYKCYIGVHSLPSFYYTGLLYLISCNIFWKYEECTTLRSLWLEKKLKIVKNTESFSFPLFFVSLNFKIVDSFSYVLQINQSAWTHWSAQILKMCFHWQVSDTETRLECLLNNNKNSDFCAPLTSFDWNEVDPNLLGKNFVTSKH